MAAQRRRWLVTGAAGFIGSHLTEALLAAGQEVVGLDNFATGYPHNWAEATAEAPPKRFRFIEADICDPDACRAAVEGVDIVLHQAALGSVPRSIADPARSNAVNVGGFLNMLIAAKDAEVERFVFAGSSTVYGDHPALPKLEHRIGAPLSPYGVTKLANELYAKVFQETYGLTIIGLRYFNIFGPRQNPNGAYAAVIPQWTTALLRRAPLFINGDGETSRDFCFVANAVQANLRAALAEESATGRVYNVAVGDRTTLNDLFSGVVAALRASGFDTNQTPDYRDFRPGDQRHSQADIALAKTHLGYRPTHRLAHGLREAMPWYIAHLMDER